MSHNEDVAINFAWNPSDHIAMNDPARKKMILE